MHTEHSNSGDESDGDSMVEVDDGLYSHDDSSTETLMVDPVDIVQQTPAEKKAAIKKMREDEGAANLRQNLRDLENKPYLRSLCEVLESSQNGAAPAWSHGD